MKNKPIMREEKTEIIIDEEGNSTERKTIKEKSIRTKSEEPDYIKIYTGMWCEFMEIDPAWRNLFYALACRMTYANTTDPNGGQAVYTGKPFADAIMQECGWESVSMLRKGLQELCKKNAIRRLGRGVYQINPNYAGRGYWEYKAQYKQGGICDLVAKFNLRNKTVETTVVLSETAENRATNHILDEEERERGGNYETAVAKYTEITGQMAFDGGVVDDVQGARASCSAS